MASLTRALTSSSRRPQLLNLLLGSNPKLTRSINTMTISPATDSESESDDNFWDLFCPSCPSIADEEAVKHPFVMEGPKYLCSVKHEESAAYARIDLPGVAKEGVKVWVKNDSLFVKAEEEKKENEGFSMDEKVRKYLVGIDLSQRSYEKEKIKAFMENGVLRVLIPYPKLEEEKGAFKINVE